jgi:hypothetical protein
MGIPLCHNQDLSQAHKIFLQNQGICGQKGTFGLNLYIQKRIDSLKDGIDQ